MKCTWNRALSAISHRLRWQSLLMFIEGMNKNQRKGHYLLRFVLRCFLCLPRSGCSFLSTFDCFENSCCSSYWNRVVVVIRTLSGTWLFTWRINLLRSCFSWWRWSNWKTNLSRSSRGIFHYVEHMLMRVLNNSVEKNGSRKWMHTWAFCRIWLMAANEAMQWPGFWWCACGNMSSFIGSGLKSHGVWVELLVTVMSSALAIVPLVTDDALDLRKRRFFWSSTFGVNFNGFDSKSN